MRQQPLQESYRSLSQLRWQPSRRSSHWRSPPPRKLRAKSDIPTTAPPPARHPSVAKLALHWDEWRREQGRLLPRRNRSLQLRPDRRHSYCLGGNLSPDQAIWFAREARGVTDDAAWQELSGRRRSRDKD